MALYTCITCRVGFLDSELQRGHYKTDWHRYNLKRKVADLPPVTTDTFQQKVLAQKSKVSEDSQDQSTVCPLCSKHFSTTNAYDNHLKSKKHKDMVLKQTEKLKEEIEKNTDTTEKNNEKNADVSEELVNNEKRLMKDCVNMAKKMKYQEAEASSKSNKHSGKPKTGNIDKMELSADSDAESCDSWDENTIGLEECLFCSLVSSSLENNLSHMMAKHSLFIPDAEYVVDLEGLITYLGEKVGAGHICLWCNEKGKSFHSTQAVQKHMIDKGHCKILFEGDVVYEYTDFYDYRSSYPDRKDEEFDEGAVGGRGLEDVEMEDDDDEEEEVQQNILETDGYQLVLPSGSTVGHRSLLKYYRQNLPHRQTNRTKAILPSMLAQYKALGWTGTTGEKAQKRVKDLAYMQRMKNSHYQKIGVKANKLQKHYRDQNFI